MDKVHTKTCATTTVLVNPVPCAYIKQKDHTDLVNLRP